MEKGNKAIYSIYIGEHVQSVAKDACKWLTKLLNAKTMPDEFDSHQFILELAHQHQRLYVQALVTFADMDHPFMVVHGEIARRLSHTSLVKKIGERDSEDIFRQVNSAVLWKKE